MAVDGQEFDVFLSHNSLDKPIVRELARLLGERNIRVWADWDQLTPGQPWQPLLEDGIRRSRSIAVLIGTDGLGPWEQEEMQAALQLAVREHRPVIPCLLPTVKQAPELPLFLAGRTWVNLGNELSAASIGGLIWGITGIRPADGEVASWDALRDVGAVKAGFDVLRDLMKRDSAVRDAVARSQDALANTSKQIGRIDLFKLLHDALHQVEFECLRPLHAGGPGQRLRPFKVAFDTQAGRMRAGVKEGEMVGALLDEISDELQFVETAFQQAVGEPNEGNRATLLGELDTLFSGLPPRLDAEIADAAAQLDLNLLVDLMSAVRDALVRSAVDGNDHMASFVASVDALVRLRDELRQRVGEHGQLQRLDSKLRTVCVGGTAAGRLGSEWARIKLTRGRIQPPYSPQFEARLEDLSALEAEIEAAMTRGASSEECSDLLRDYFRAVGTVFRDVDTSLKDFCLGLSQVNQPLATLLDIVRADASSGRLS